MSERQGNQGSGYFSELGAQTYTLLTTFRRDGTPVATAVHLVAGPDGEAGYFRTWHTTGKAKRLRHTQRVEVGPSTATGKPTGPSIPAHARLLTGDEAKQAARLLAGKHPFLHGVLIPRLHRLRGWQTLHYELIRPPGPTADLPGSAASPAREEANPGTAGRSGRR